MKPVYYLAVDIGASSGRHILASMDNGRMTIEEVYRFDNGMINDNGNKLWDVDSLFANIIEGMKKCKELGKIPVSMSIDTWAVDYVLLDDNDKCIGNVYGYRDERTDGMDEEVYKVISEKELYKRTGIQKQKFNTIYQLMSDKFIRPEQLKEANTFIMLPDYFQFILTGVKASEYTNATSTQLVNPETKQWDYELIDMLGINRNMFMELKQPGTILGELTDGIKKIVGYNTRVVMCASHDTASAVMAVPTVADNVLYLSSGTWSLMGTELIKARCDEKSQVCNFTNEGGYDYNVHQDATFLPLDLQCERKIVRGDRIVPMVSATASRNKEGVVHISLSNVDLTESQDITLSLGDMSIKSVTGRILTSESIDDYNSFEHSDVVVPKDFKGAKIQKNGLQVKLPAKSIVVLEVK